MFNLNEGAFIMRVYVIILVQFLIWSSFSIASWVSNQDGIKSKSILFLVFSYLAFWVATTIGLTKGKALFTTLVTMAAFFSCQQLFWFAI